MKKALLFAVSALMVACAGDNEKIDFKTINIEQAVDNPTELAASKLGKSLRYVALETSDTTSLVGNNPLVRKWKDKLIVGSDKTTIKVFDAATGRYLGSVGEINRGPRGSGSLTNFIINPSNGDLYVPAFSKDEYRVWDISGNFLGSVAVPQKESGSINADSRLVPLITQNNLDFLAGGELVKFDGGGFNLFAAGDTTYNRLTIRDTTSAVDMSNIASLAVFKSDIFGTLSKEGVIMITTKDDKVKYNFTGERPFYRYGGELRFKDLAGDTAYVVRANGVIPIFAFDAGRYKLTPRERETGKYEGKRIRVGQIIESDRAILFEMAQEGGLHGYWDKESGEVVTYKEKIKDDLNNFLPFLVHSTTPEGGFIAILEAIEVVDWAEQNPAKKSPLPAVKEADNIVVAIIE